MKPMRIWIINTVLDSNHPHVGTVSQLLQVLQLDTRYVLQVLPTSSLYSQSWCSTFTFSLSGSWVKSLSSQSSKGLSKQFSRHGCQFEIGHKGKGRLVQSSGPVTRVNEGCTRSSGHAQLHKGKERLVQSSGQVVRVKGGCTVRGLEEFGTSHKGGLYGVQDRQQG